MTEERNYKIEKIEKKEREKINIFTVFWFFIIGSVVGFVVETIWCFLKYGYFESRTSLIFIPFVAIYGFGAVALYIGIHSIKPKKTMGIFIFGMVAGTIVEYVASFTQETIFGTVSWNYTDMPFNINGRVCLNMSILWGLLAIMWVKFIQPFFVKIINLIPEKIKKPLSITLLVVLSVSAVISIIAVIRWTQRVHGVLPKNVIEHLIDNVFTDNLMKLTYPNMIFLN